MNKFLTLGLSLAAVAGLASCDNKVNEDVVPAPEAGALPEIVLPQAPDLVISSNGEVVAGNATKAGATRATTKYENDEVEINLSLQDAHKFANGANKYDVADLVSHLSIHVRSYTDVKVTLPVPAAIYCDQDDLYIYNERGEVAQFDGSVNKATYSLPAGETYKVSEYNAATNKYEDVTYTTDAGVKVTLTVNFAKATYETVDGKQVVKEPGSIEISTEGITKEVIDYCKYVYGDGLNFDAYNYYNRANVDDLAKYDQYTVPQLLQVLNNSEVQFLGSTYTVEGKESVDYYAPDYYINAFTYDETDAHNVVEYDGNPYYIDCWVAPMEEQKSFFYLPTESRGNVVWVNKTAVPNATDGNVVKNVWLGNPVYTAPAPQPEPDAQGSNGN
ncbi:MAG: hypothetical protein J1E16_02960 [Muribaculaceae bacterium]|nr:hypothetical protein [Muribaculaceae bacterium]